MTVRGRVSVTPLGSLEYNRAQEKERESHKACRQEATNLFPHLSQELQPTQCYLYFQRKGSKILFSNITSLSEVLRLIKSIVTHPPQHPMHSIALRSPCHQKHYIKTNRTLCSFIRRSIQLASSKWMKLISYTIQECSYYWVQCIAVCFMGFLVLIVDRCWNAFCL